MTSTSGSPRVRYYAAQSLDGYVAGADHGLGWLLGYSGHPSTGEPADGAVEAFTAGIGAFVMGARTYEFILAALDADGAGWPYAGGPTWVLTSRALPVPQGADVRIAARPAAGVVREALQAAGGRDVWVVGGGPVAQDLLDAGLLDTVEVTVVPVVLGAGIPLFAGRVAAPMVLERVRPFDNGVVELAYRVASDAR